MVEAQSIVDTLSEITQLVPNRLSIMARVTSNDSQVLITAYG